MNCNKCGIDCDRAYDEALKSPYGLSTSVSGGYLSDYLVDGHTYEFNICEKCLREMFDGFITKPLVKFHHYEQVRIDELKNTYYEIVPYEIVPYEKDKSIFEEALWLNNGGEKEKYLQKLCSITYLCKNTAKYSLVPDDMSFDDFIYWSACKECYELLETNGKYNGFHATKYIPEHLLTFI